MDEAARTATPVPGRADRPDLDLDTAYDVQAASVGLRLARGERPAGVKMGFTSEAKMRQMGVNEMIWGRLTDAMRVEDGGTFGVGAHIHPRAEPEIAFRLARAPGPGADPAAVVEAVAPAIEIINSRYVDFRFTVPEVIADNASAAAFVVGPWVPLTGPLDDLDVVLEIDGEPAQKGSTAAILGDPLRALTEAFDLTARRGLRLSAGDIVLAGAATAAVPVRPGSRVRARVAGLGSAGFTAVP
nr:fumarylacetoacetate hydrolase family protein [Sphaerisporangium rubeum]